MAGPPLLTPAMIAALEGPRQARMLAAVAPTVEPFAGGVMGFHEPGSWQNQACGVGLAGPVGDDEIDAMIAFYESRGVEPRVELSPFAHESLVAGLAARGFVVREFENVLARALPADERLDDLLPHGRPAGLELRPLDPRDDQAVRRSADLTLRGFFEPDAIPPAMREACEAALRLPGTFAYLAFVDGVLVATGSANASGEVASLMGVSTLASHRGRGIQQALIVERLAAARARGCTLATIGSRPGIPTERNAMRLGFVMGYTTVILVRPGAGLEPSH